jgi:hypothetical protein
MRPAHILSRAYKSKFTHVREWDLNIGSETNHFTELSVSVSAVLDIKITIVFGATLTVALLKQALASAVQLLAT